MIWLCHKGNMDTTLCRDITFGINFRVSLIVEIKTTCEEHIAFDRKAIIMNR